MDEEIYKYCIYKITNNINGKIYVGQHKLKKNERHRDYMGSGLAIKEAYKQYGRQNFTKEIIEYIEDDEKHEYVSEREIYWIKELNSKYPNGYNISDGGEGGCTKESANKGAITRKNNGYIHHSEETKRKISESHKGKTFSKEHKQHLSDNHHLKKEWTIEHEDGSIEVYDGSLTEYCKKYNISTNTLKRKSAQNKFVSGIKLIDMDFLQYACLKNYNNAYKNMECFDPIKKEICSYYALKNRKYRDKDLYKNVIIKECIINKGDKNEIRKNY